MSDKNLYINGKPVGEISSMTLRGFQSYGRALRSPPICTRPTPREQFQLAYRHLRKALNNGSFRDDRRDPLISENFDRSFGVAAFYALYPGYVEDFPSNTPGADVKHIQGPRIKRYDPVTDDVIELESYFDRTARGWRWVVFYGGTRRVWHVVEIDYKFGGLWEAREVAQSYCHKARATSISDI
jgi:hypothetical protein